MDRDSIDIRPAGAAPPQLAAYSRLLCEVFGDEAKFSETALAWRYRDNPAGQVVGADAWCLQDGGGERLAAHYVACPVEAVVEGRPLKGLVSLNTATHPDYQGRGLFTRLAEHAYAQAADAGYAFVVGVANANSTPGFLRKLAFQDVGRLEAGVLTRLPKRFGDAPLQYRAAWRPELLAWRLANPAADYAVAASGGLTGVWARTHLPFVRCAAFLDERPSPGAGAPLAMSLFIGLDPRWDTKAMVPVPERLRPSPLNLIWRSLGDAPAALDPRAVAFNFLDFDPY